MKTVTIKTGESFELILTDKRGNEIARKVLSIKSESITARKINDMWIIENLEIDQNDPIISAINQSNQ